MYEVCAYFGVYIRQRTEMAMMMMVVIVVVVHFVQDSGTEQLSID
jgi:hypothetical protein